MVHVAFSRSISSQDASLASSGSHASQQHELDRQLRCRPHGGALERREEGDELCIARGVDRPRSVGPGIVDAAHGIEARDVVALDREADQSAQSAVHLRGTARRIALARSVDTVLQRHSRQATDLHIADPRADVEIEVVLEHGDGSLAHRSAALARAAQTLVSQPLVEYFSHGRQGLRRLAGLAGRDRRMIGFAFLRGLVFDIVLQQLRTSVRQRQRGIGAHRQPVTCAIDLDPVLPMLGESLVAVTQPKIEAGIDQEPLLAAARGKLQRLDFLVSPSCCARHCCCPFERPTAFGIATYRSFLRYRFGYHFRLLGTILDTTLGKHQRTVKDAKPSTGAACRPIADVLGFPRTLRKAACKRKVVRSIRTAGTIASP